MPQRKEHAMPKNNASYVHNYKGQRYTLTVRIENGAPFYYVNKASFKTPTAAAKSITGKEVNGWKFWHID